MDFSNSLRTGSALLLTVAAAAMAACGDDGSTDQDGSKLGTIFAKLSALAEHDVTAVRFEVLSQGSPCGGPALVTKEVALESEALPASAAGEASARHAFSDALFVLAPGSYRVCATPLHDAAASTECAAAETDVTVVAGATNEILLVSQCAGAESGATDVIVELNTAPTISSLSLDPSKFITTCEAVSLQAVASDEDGDALSFVWSVGAGPVGATLHSEEAHATFFGPAGDYEAQVTVSDPHFAHASLTFPLHVSAETCSVPEAVQTIFTTQCAPCHITGASGGLSLASGTASYTNLVGHVASAAACADRTRVVPGAAETSYLVQKLRGTAGICGTQMPRGRPPLAETEIAIIEAWINGLPH